MGKRDDDSEWATIVRQVRDGVITRETGQFKHSLLHTTVVGRKRLRLHEAGVKGLQVMTCLKCRQQHQQIWRWQDAGKKIVLSRQVTEPVWSGRRKNIVTVPPPTNSFSAWDPGRIGSLPQLSLMEKTDIAVFVVASCVHKIQKAPDEIAKWRIRGHTIVFLSNSPKVLLSRVSATHVCS